MSCVKNTVIVAILASEAEGLLRAKMRTESDTCDKVTKSGETSLTDGEKGDCTAATDMFFKSKCSTTNKCTEAASDKAVCDSTSWGTQCKPTCCVTSHNMLTLAEICKWKDLGAAKDNSTALPKKTGKIETDKTCGDAATKETFSTYDKDAIEYVATTCCEAKGGKSGGGCYGPCR